jgi:hypothetical protein
MTTKKLLLLAAAAMSAIASPAAARKAKAPEFVGKWCLTQSVQNGHDALTGEYIPRTNFYERAKADCPDYKRITIGPHSLDGLEYDFTPGEDGLRVEGQPKTKKGKR